MSSLGALHHVPHCEMVFEGLAKNALDYLQVSGAMTIERFCSTEYWIDLGYEGLRAS